MTDMSFKAFSFLLSSMILVALIADTCKIALSYPLKMRHSLEVYEAMEEVFKTQCMFTTSPSLCHKNK